MAKIRHSVMNKSNDMVQSSDFDDNGQFEENKEYGENSSKSARIQRRWQRAPLKEAIMRKIANMAISQSVISSQVGWQSGP